MFVFKCGWWRTRNEQKVWVETNTKPGLHSIVGWFPSGELVSWKADGTVSGPYKDDRDLIEPCSEYVSSTYLPFTAETLLPHVGRIVVNKEDKREYFLLAGFSEGSIHVGSNLIKPNDLLRWYKFQDSGLPCGTLE